MAEESKKAPEVSDDVINHIENIANIIQRNKARMSISPSHARMIEILNASKEQGYEMAVVKQALRILVKQKRLRYGSTIKEVYFETPNQKKQ